MALLVLILTLALVCGVPFFFFNSALMQAWLDWCAAVPILPYATGAVVAAILIAFFELTGIIDEL